MFSKEIIVRCESGLHNRQATYFVQKANEFTSSIWIESENRKMNAKSLLGIMSLGIITGATVVVTNEPDVSILATAEHRFKGERYRATLGVVVEDVVSSGIADKL